MSNISVLSDYTHRLREARVSGGWWIKATLIVAFGLALAIRVWHLDDSRLVAERQYRSALIARALYLEGDESVPAWRREVAAASRERAGVLEPPILETFVSVLYRITGGESLWLARLLNTLCWLGGGALFLRILLRVAPPRVSIIPLVYYLFVPIGVVVSVSFLPESLMMFTLLAALLTMLRYFEHQSTRRLIVAAVVSGLAILVKPFCAFTVLSAFIALALYHYSWRRVVNPRVVAFLLICCGVGAAYYVYGMFVGGFLSSNLKASFLPYHYFEKDYWTGWAQTGAGAVGLPALVAAFVGASLIPRGATRALLVGLVIGYVLFGLVYTYPIAIAGYYHIQLIIIVCIAIAPLISLIVEQYRRLSPDRYAWVVLLIGGVTIVYFSVQRVRDLFASMPRMVNEETARRIGELVQHSERVVYVSEFYGMPLEYRGELSGTYWPERVANLDWVKDRLGGEMTQGEERGIQRVKQWIVRTVEARPLTLEERFRSLGFIPDYFVVTDIERYERNHDDLRAFLEAQCTLVAEGRRHFVYDVRACVP